MRGAIFIFFFAGALLVVQSLWAYIDGVRFRSLVRRSMSSPLGTFAPFAAVVIPCKGVDAGFDANLERFLAQDYPDYQVVFAVATTDDAAYQRLQVHLRRLPSSGSSYRPRTAVVVAGLPKDRGEKVNNLLRGIEAVDKAAQVFVFADIDAKPSPGWLRSLLAPLADSRVTASTGFRWYLPGKGFVSRLRAAWDTSIATMMGDYDHNFAWGGSMAIRAADFRNLGMARKYWAHTVSDDYSLTRAVRESGGKIAFEPLCLVAAQEESSLREFFRWSTRQIIITRVYMAHLWRLGLAVYLFYCGTFAWGAVVLSMRGVSPSLRWAVAGILLTVLLLGAAKGYIRTLVTRELFGGELAGSASCYWQFSPLVPWVMLSNFLAAAFTRRIDWRGTEYELVSRDEVRIVSRNSG